MLALGFLAMPLLHPPDAGAHLLLSGAAMLVCAALGGDVFAQGGASAGAGTASASIGALPLGLTIAGLTVLAVLFVRRTRSMSQRLTILAMARTTAVFGAATGILDHPEPP